MVYFYGADFNKENNYGSRRWMILEQILTEVDSQTALVPTRMDKRTQFQRKQLPRMTRSLEKALNSSGSHSTVGCFKNQK